jgi:Na+/H+-dicarboxylate symporter
VGICSLIATSIASIEDLAHTFSRLGLFVVAVSVGIAAHQLIVMPAIHFATTRTNPFTVLARSMKAWFVGFASTSS